jgi:hypothetical protein
MNLNPANRIGLVDLVLPERLHLHAVLSYLRHLVHVQVDFLATMRDVHGHHRC